MKTNVTTAHGRHWLTVGETAFLLDEDDLYALSGQVHDALAGVEKPPEGYILLKHAAAVCAALGWEGVTPRTLRQHAYSGNLQVVKEPYYAIHLPSLLNLIDHRVEGKYMRGGE